MTTTLLQIHCSTAVECCGGRGAAFQQCGKFGSVAPSSLGLLRQHHEAVHHFIKYSTTIWICSDHPRIQRLRSEMCGSQSDATFTASMVLTASGQVEANRQQAAGYLHLESHHSRESRKAGRRLVQHASWPLRPMLGPAVTS